MAGPPSALVTLAADLPAAVLADLIGIHINSAVRWTHYAQRDWASYLAARAGSDRYEVSRNGRGSDSASEVQDMDVVILIGLQASGKTTFYHQRLAADHAHVSKDAFPNARRRQRRQMRLIHDALTAGRSVAVDNTNPSPDEWQPIIEAARSHAARVVGYWFPPDPTASLRRNTARAGKTLVPDIGVYATLKRLRRPRLVDGFDELHVVEFDGTGGFVIQPLTEEG